MTIKICDRCKEIPKDLRPLRIITLQKEGGDFRNLDWWIGKKDTVGLCTTCIEVIFSAGTQTHQS